MVFEHYALLDGAEIQKSGELAIRCPFHDGTSRTLKANDTKRGFQCFAPDCGKKGNVIDFVAFMEEESFRGAALLLHEWFPQTSDAATPQSPQRDEATEFVADPSPDTLPPPASGRGYMRTVEAKLKELLAADDPPALIKWVKQELLDSYHRGMDKQKASSGAVTS